MAMNRVSIFRAAFNALSVVALIVVNCLCVICMFWSLTNEDTGVAEVAKASDGVQCSWQYLKGQCSESCMYIYRAGDLHFGQSCRLPGSEQSWFDMATLYALVWLSGVAMLGTVMKVTLDSVRGGSCAICIDGQECGMNYCSLEACEAACYTRRKSSYTVVQIGQEKKEFVGSILITGGCGCLGRSVVEECVKDYPNHQIVVFDIAKVADPSRSFVQVIADITNQEHVSKAVSTFRPEIVFHLAAIIPNIDTSSELLYKVNVQGTLNLLQSAKLYGTKKFLLSSSVSVLLQADWTRTWYDLSPSMPYSPEFIDNYAESKALSEQFTIMSNDPDSGFLTTALRLPGLVGWGDEHFTMAALKKNIIGRGIVSWGETFLDVLEVQNAAAGMIQASKHLETIHGRVFNLGGEVVNFKEYRDALAPNIWKFYLPRPLLYSVGVLNEWIYYLSGGNLWIDKHVNKDSVSYSTVSWSVNSEDAIKAFGYDPVKYGASVDRMNKLHRPRYLALLKGSKSL